VLWISDADFAAIYRRGNFVGSNAVPTVALTSPLAGQVFAPRTDITLQATAKDPDGTLAKVEFYQGSTKLGESVSNPYSFTWQGVLPGTYNLLARAIDNLGTATDSKPVAIVVGAAPRLTGQVVNGHFQVTIRGDVGSVVQVQRSSDLQTWSSLGSTITNVNGSLLFQDPNPLSAQPGFYRVRQR
jgi:hypothetical protein